jgi:hypothetical protein
MLRQCSGPFGELTRLAQVAGVGLGVGLDRKHEILGPTSSGPPGNLLLHGGGIVLQKRRQILGPAETLAIDLAGACFRERGIRLVRPIQTHVRLDQVGVSGASVSSDPNFFLGLSHCLFELPPVLVRKRKKRVRRCILGIGLDPLRAGLVRPFQITHCVKALRFRQVELRK